MQTAGHEGGAGPAARAAELADALVTMLAGQVELLLRECDADAPFDEARMKHVMLLQKALDQAVIQNGRLQEMARAEAVTSETEMRTFMKAVDERIEDHVAARVATLVANAAETLCAQCGPRFGAVCSAPGATAP